jgi:SAM-dependent methyltransferase
VDKIIARVLNKFGFTKSRRLGARDTVNLPYFDELLKLLGNGNTAVKQSFGRHVHWGYWENPQKAGLSHADFAEAAENLSRELCRAAPIHNGVAVLDVGCGFGGTIAYINDNYENMVLTGLNLDARQLQRAQEQIIPRSGNRIDFVRGNACRLPFPDHCFDVVLAVECIFHFPSREQFFGEVWRVLKPDGILALSDFIPAPVIVPFAKIRLPARLSRGFYGKCNVQYTLAAYRQLANDSGFKIPAARDITLNTLPTYAYLRKLARETAFFNGFALIETATLEVLSRLRLIKYYLITFQKKE